MVASDNYQTLPDNLPIPVDDGACDHLTGMRLPKVVLPSTAGDTVQLAALIGKTILYIYPRTGQPGVELPVGWDEIPGARGCTPQACSFRDHYHELQQLNVQVYGLSTQSTAYQHELAERLHLPYPLLSDAQLTFATALTLPTFTITYAGKEEVCIKRLTLIINNGIIEYVFYPIFPSDKNVDDVLHWLRNQQTVA